MSWFSTVRTAGRRRLDARFPLLSFAAVSTAAACVLAGQAAGRPVVASLNPACTNFGSAPPSAAVLRTCAGLTTPKEKLELEGNKSGVVTLHSPFSVDTKTAVACGSNCIYHHWNWSGGFLGDIAVAGCAANDETCKVDLNKLTGVDWTIVTVSLDDNNQGNMVAFVVSKSASPPKCPGGSTVNATMQRSAAATAGASPVTFQSSGSTKNLVRVLYTPCGASGTVTVSWLVRPQCEAGGEARTINPYTKKVWPTYWQFAPPGNGPHNLDAANRVDLQNSSGDLVMTIAVAKGLGSATVVLHDLQSLKRSLPNEMNGAGDSMHCWPQGETLSLKPK
jgi:hypothetical protein